MKRRTIVGIICALLAVPVITVGILAITGRLHFVSAKEKETQYISSSWSYSYGSIRALAQDSDLIALVKVTDPGNTVIDSGLPYTTFTVEVIMPVYHVSEGDTFSIFMTGGETEDRIVEVSDDPLLKEGEQCLVFCKQNSDGTYQILGGPQGRLVYENGCLTSLCVIIGKEDSYTVLARDVDAETLIEQICSYVENE